MIIINCATNSTLQELKTNQSSGVFIYQNSDDVYSITSNRHIVWRTCNDMLELSEHSLSKNLIDGNLKVQFKNTLILPNGISIHETPEKIYILVTTLVSAHRLIFDHPRSSLVTAKSPNSNTSTNSYQSSATGLMIYSIFHNVSSSVLTSDKNYCQLPNSTTQNAMLGSSASFPFLACCSWINQNLEAFFVVSKSCATLHIIKLPSLLEDAQESDIKVNTIDLKQTSLLGKTFSLISGLVSSKANTDGNRAAINLLSHSLMDDDFIFALCQDFRIRVLSLKEQKCLIEHNLLQNPLQTPQSTNMSNFSNKEATFGTSSVNVGQQFRQPISMKLWWHDDNTNMPLPNLVVFLAGPKSKSFYFYETLISPYNTLSNIQPSTTVLNSSFSANHTMARFQAEPHLRFLLEVVVPLEQDLIDYFVSENQIWALMQCNDMVNLQYYSIETSHYQCQSSQSPLQWIPVIADVNATPEISLRSPLSNLREYYLNEIFWKGHFSLSTIAKAITVSNRLLIENEKNDFSKIKIDQLIKDAIKHVDSIIRSQIGENNFEISAEEYAKMEMDAWHSLYLFCLDYNTEENKPLSIFVDYKTKVKGIVRLGKVDYVPSLHPFDELIDYYFLLCKESSSESFTDDSNGSSNLFFENVFEYRLNTLIAPIDASINGIFTSTLEQSILQLLYGMSVINQTLSKKDLLDFEAFMNRLSSFSSKCNLSLKDIAKMITEDSLMPDIKPISDSPEPFIDDFFNKCPMVAEAINFLLQCISFDFTSNPNEILEHLGVNSNHVSMDGELHLKMQDAMQYEVHSSLFNLLSSQCGLEFIAKSIRKIVSTRYKFCRDLFLFQFMLTKFRFSVKSDHMPKIVPIEAETIPQTASMLFALDYLSWASQTPMVNSNIWWTMSDEQPITSLVGNSLSPSTNKLKSNGPLGSSSLENNELLSVLELREFIDLSRFGMLSHHSTFYNAYPHSNILHFFIQFNGGIISKRLLSYKLVAKYGEELNNVLSSIWSIVIPSYFSSICQLLWPLSAGQFKVAEFLLGVGQFDLLESYIQRLHNWCMTYSYSRFFLKGICNLVTGEGQKAIQQFKQAVFGINSDPFLHKIFAKKGKIIESSGLREQPTSNEDLSLLPNARTLFRYYSKLIQLFKRYSSPDFVIEFVKVALDNLDKNIDPEYDAHYCSFQSTLFACHLRLGNVVQAYGAMMNNSDPDQKRICLRQFILNQCETGQLASLVSFPYQGLEDEFVSILESKARASSARFYSGKHFHMLDACSTTSRLSSASTTASELGAAQSSNYYQILYAYFIRVNNYRRAAQCSYDYYRRLNQESNMFTISDSVELLQQQADSLLFARNCLKLVDPKYSWIIKNAIKKTDSLENGGEIKNKRKYGNMDIGSTLTNHQEKTVIDIVDDDELLCEYELVSARLRLLQRDPKEFAIASTILTPEETAILCIEACLYEQAFRISTLYKLSLEPIFDGMTSKYVQLLHHAHNRRRIDDEMLLSLFGTLSDPETGHHQMKQQTSEVNGMMQSFPIDLLDIFYENGSNAAKSSFISYSSLSICDRMWHLIMHNLARYETQPQKSSHLMRRVAEKLLANGIMLPTSLLKIYQKVNCPEIIRLLISFNFLSEATQVSLDYMNAFMGNGTEYFDIKHHLYANCPPLCIPMHIFDYLLKALREENDEHNLNNCQAKLAIEDSVDPLNYGINSVDDYQDEEKIDYEELYKKLSKKRQKLIDIMVACSK